MLTNNSKQAFWVALGSVFSVSLGIISSMILSRYLTKNDYGTYKQVLYVYMTLTTVFTLGLPRAYSYFIPRVPITEVRSLIKKINRLFFLMGGIFSLLLYFFSGTIAIYLNNPSLELSLKIFSPVPLFLLPTMGLDGILASFKKTVFLSFYTFITKLITLLSAVVPVVFLGLDYNYAILGFVIASFISFLIAMYFKFSPIRDQKTYLDSLVTYKDILKFSLPLLFASMWGAIIAASDQFFISRFYGTTEFADFSNGNMQLPFVGMITSACSVVLTPLFSEIVFKEENPIDKILPIWRNVFEKSAKIIYPLVIFSWIFAESIMILLYGPIYISSSSYFRIKLIVNLFTLITYAPLVIAIGKTKLYAKVQFIGVIILVCLQYCVVLLDFSPHSILVVSVLCQISRILILVYLIADFFGVSFFYLIPFNTLKHLTFNSIVSGVLSFYIISLFDIENCLINLIVSFVLFVFFYFSGAFILKIDYFSIVQPLLKKYNR